MIIDDKRQFVLTKYASLKGLRKKVESDHNALVGSFTLPYNVKKPELRK